MKSIFYKRLYTMLLSVGCSTSAFTTGIINSDTTALQSKERNTDNRLTILDLEKLITVRRSINDGSKQYNAAINSLIKSADKALNEGPFSVTHKTQTPISGDKNDYLSIGIYWWPNPLSPNGLPWENKDGQKNPAANTDNYDVRRKGKFFKNTYHLALAYFFSGEEKYAEKAKELLKVWFITPKTRMNPNLNYAQGIPGRNHGRGIGIIEFVGLLDIITAIEILELHNSLGTSISKGLRDWMNDYLYWLQTSDNGIFEKNKENNHGTWYDAQEIGLLLFLDREEEARNVIKSVKQNRIATQIEADGRQPHELSRTRSLHYSIYNLTAFTHLAYFGKKLNIDLWNYTPEQGGSIRNAYNFLYPYANNEKNWALEEISGINRGISELKTVIHMAGSLFNVNAYCSIKTDENKKDDLVILLYPCLM